MFKTNIKATNIELSMELRDYIEKRLATLDKFFRGDEEVVVNIEIGRLSQHHKNGDIYKAEIHLMPPGKEYYAVVEKDDLYAAIDEVKDEVVREMTSSKKKAVRLFRRGGAKVKEFIKMAGDVKNFNWKGRWKK